VPEGLPVADMVRFVMYADGLRPVWLGRENFLRMAAEHQAVRCGDCETCAVQCPHGVQVSQRFDARPGVVRVISDSTGSADASALSRLPDGLAPSVVPAATTGSGITRLYWEHEDAVSVPDDLFVWRMPLPAAPGLEKQIVRHGDFGVPEPSSKGRGHEAPERSVFAPAREAGFRVRCAQLRSLDKDSLVEMDEIRRGEIWWAISPNLAAPSLDTGGRLLVIQADSFNRSRIQTAVVPRSPAIGTCRCAR